MGYDMDDAKARWDEMGRPTGSELAALEDHAEARRRVLHDLVVKLKRANPAHSDCPGAPQFDEELGGICYCGLLLGFPEGMESQDKALVPSVTTQAAGLAKPLRVADAGGISSAVDPGDPILAQLDIIDPTMPYDSKMVEEHILDTTARLERGVHYERICAEDYTDKVLKFEMAHSRARLKAMKECGGSEGDRVAWANVEVETEYVERMIAKMKLDAIKGTMHSLRSALSAYQSVAKSIASTYSAVNSATDRRAF